MWTEEELEKALAESSPEEISALIDSLRRLVLITAKTELKKALIRRFEGQAEEISERLEKVEAYTQGKPIKKKLWPSLGD